MKHTTFFFLLMILLANAEAQQQKGFVSLFDGKSLTGWKQVSGSAKYSVENDMIVGETVPSSPNTFLVTEKEYGDFILELDIKMEDTSSNSGIQFRSHINPDGNDGKGRVYGYQFEIDPSNRKWSGGVYDEARRDWLYPVSLHPQAQSAFKINDFNHVRIECKGHEIRTWLNNVAIANVIDTVDASGFIALQVHSINNEKQVGKKIWWKNIRIKTTDITLTPLPEGMYIVNNVPNTLSDYEKKNGWKLLFDGTSTKGWRGAYKNAFPEGGWQVKNGTLTVLSSEGKESANGGDIVTTDEYSAFDLSFEFKLTPGANSGVKYFVTLSENNSGSAIGLEYQVLDDSLHPDAKLGRDGNRTMASLYDLIKANKQKRFIHQPGEWNIGRVVVYPNNHVEHYLNGIKVLEYDRGSQAYKDLVAISKYKVWPNFGEAKQGHILLQDHGNEVSFRSIKIKALK